MDSTYIWLKRPRTSYLIVLAATLAGCRASMVVSPGRSSTSAYAPVNEAKRPGIIKYLNEGVQAVRTARRENAYQQMYEACGGAYRITQEGSHAEGGAVIPVGNMAIYDESQYLYIAFECVDKIAGAPAN